MNFFADFDPEARHTIFDVVEMENELQQLFGRDVDLVEKRAIVNSDNFLRRRHILSTAQVMYRD